MEWVNWIENIVIILTLAVLAVEDVKMKSIDVRCIAGIGLVSLAYGVIRCAVWSAKCSLILIIAGIVFVGFLLIMSVVLKAIGLGDVAVLCMLILAKGVVFAVSTFMLAVTIMAVVVILLLTMRKLRRKDKVAFVPYIALAAMGVMICV